MLVSIFANKNTATEKQTCLINPEMISSVQITHTHILLIQMQDGVVYSILNPEDIILAASESPIVRQIYEMFVNAVTPNREDEDAYYDHLAEEYFLTHGVQDYPNL